MIYFISDTHFGHSNIINYCERPFSDVHEMNKTIINNINDVVTKDDSLYILGDFCFKNKKPLDYRIKISCHNVYLILGNHDKRTDYFPNDYTVDMHGFKEIKEVQEIIYCNQRIFLSHYPHRSWPASHKGSYHLYGHVHSKLNHEDVASGRKTLDVGVDNAINYNKPFGQPWSFKEIQKIFNERSKHDN